MLKHRLLHTSFLAAAVLCCSTAVQAQSLTLNFDSLSTPEDVLPYGLQWSHIGGVGVSHFILDGTTVVNGFTYLTPPLPSGKFLAYYSLESQSETLSLAPGLSNTFALNSVDLGGVIGDGGFQQSDKLSIQIIGTKLDGTTVTAESRFNLKPGSFTTYGNQYFAGFTGLTSLKFSGTGTNNARYVGVDNLSLTIAPVPEPETYALLLAGLGLVASMARKRKVA